MKVVSLFDGYAGGRLALDMAGIPVTRYLASEIDKYAMFISNKNYPDIKQVGDVTKLRGFDLPRTDLLLGGSPCQGFSAAGKGLDFADPRSKLFFEYVRILKLIRLKNPDALFLLENVKMKSWCENIITDILQVEPLRINSALVSAQERKRLYWTNIKGVEQPEDRGIFLQDIIDYNEPYPFTAEIWDKPAKGQLIRSGTAIDVRGHDSIKRVYDIAGKSPTLTTMQGGHREPKISLNKAVIVGRRLDANGVRKDYDKNVPISQVLEVRHSNLTKSGCLTTVDKDNVLTHLPAGRYLDPYSGLVPYRKLTPLECERLQTLPDYYTAGVSDSQRKKMIGNGWNAATIAHILNYININDVI